MKTPKNIITVEVKGGVITNALNIPEDTAIRIVDLDNILDGDDFPAKDHYDFAAPSVETSHHYVVTWEIDYTAESPLRAAIYAREVQTEPGSEAATFTVVDDEGRSELVDLTSFEHFKEEVNELLVKRYSVVLSFAGETIDAAYKAMSRAMTPEDYVDELADKLSFIELKRNSATHGLP